MVNEPLIKIEMIYAETNQSIWMCYRVKPGCTIEEAIIESGLISEMNSRFGEVFDIHSISVGIWGENKTHQYVLNAGDRIEIYLPLIEDPKLVRQKRAKEEAASIQHQRRMRKQLRLMQSRMNPLSS